MKRDAYTELLKWKAATKRKPLLVRGARQTGKTHLLQTFGKGEYETLAYFNFEEDPQLGDFFATRVRPTELIEQLSLYANKSIRPGRDLIVFDEIQASNDALKSLKYFYENTPEYHVAAAGSLLGITLSGPGAFPVGKVSFLDLYPLTFMEYLEAVGAQKLRGYVQETTEITPFPEPLHKELTNHLRAYYFTGGMPEAVQHYATSRDPYGAREIQDEILKGYALDFAKYASAPDIPKLGMLWDIIPQQLAKENKKFVFSSLRRSARRRDFENAIEWLERSGLIMRSFRVKTAKQPLKAYLDNNIFKIYSLDVGLLGAMAGITPKSMIQGHQIFREFEGSLVENYVAQQLKAEKGFDLFYWQSSGTAEVDFICEYMDHVLPLEAKAGINPKSKSLKSFGKRFSPLALTRTTLLNLKRQDELVNLPLYAVSLFPELIAGMGRRH